MSRARNRADGDFGDLDITNIGAVSLDSIKGDADGNTSLAFSGSDVITITTGGTTAMTINGSQNTVLAGTLTAVTSIGIGSAVLTEAELEFLDGITAGAGAASKVLVLDSSADVASGLRNLTASGTLQGTTITATTAFVPDASDGAALGTTALEFSDLFLADGAVISLGDDDDVTLTHVADTGVLINGASVIQFRDSALNIGSSADGQLDIAADTEVEITTALVEISADATIGDDLTLKSDAAVLGFGADTDVTLTHVADTGLLLNSTRKLQFNDATQFIHAPTATVLDIVATDEIELTATLIDVVGHLAISGNLNLAGNLEVVGTSSTTVTASGAVVPDANDGATIGTAALAFSDIFLADGATIQLGNDEEITITHVADTGILFNTTSVIQFRDSAINIGSPADGDLDINADDEIELNSTLIDINGNVEISGTLAQADAITMATNKKIIFRDAAIHISSTADGDLSIAADDEIDLTSTLIDINGNVEVSGTTAQVGVSTSTAKDIFNAGMSTKNGATGAGFVEFFEDSDNGSNKVTLIGPASTADVTVTLPAAAGTLATTASAADEATALAIALG